MDYGSEPNHGKSKTLVIVLVVVGILMLAAGAVVAILKGPGAGAPGQVEEGEVKSWCELRREWAREVDALSADIALKSVRVEDAAERKALVRKRDALSRDYGKRVEQMNITDARVIELEKALIVEGKARANRSVEISNVLAQIPEDPDAEASLVDVGKRLEQLRKGFEMLQEAINSRIKAGKRKADEAVASALAKIPGCTGIYRGPMTDMGTSDSPWVSWKELELKRELAAKRIEERIRLLEPREQYANHVYHELVRRYGDTLSKCYAKARRKEPGMPSEIRLQIRLSKGGKVRGMLETQGRADAFVECIVTPVARGKLPAPVSDDERVVVPIDLKAFR
jgi:hypothetical protein